MEILNLQTKRVLIRELKLSDFSDFHFYRSNAEVVKYQGFGVMTLEQSQEFIQNNMTKLFGKAGEWIQYGIKDIITKKLIGDCAIKLDQNDTRIAESGNWNYNFSCRKKGILKRSTYCNLTYLFEIHQIHRVMEIVDTDNIASINLLKSIGFREERHFIENIFFKGRWGSEFQYAMLRREWNESKVGISE